MNDLANQKPPCKRNVAPPPTGSPLDPNWVSLADALRLALERAAKAGGK
jgi:hypothetical protein